MAFIVDSSVALAWMRDSQADGHSRRALERAAREALYAPVLWPLECMNALVSLERRRKIAFHQVVAVVSSLRRLGVQVEAATPDPWRLSDLARETGLSVYDAAYVELAARRGLPLATKDGKVREAAARVGVALV